MLDVSSLLLNYTFKTTAPLVDAAVNETLGQLVLRLDNSQLQLIDGGKSSPTMASFFAPPCMSSFLTFWETLRSL
jgi:hypothetical protein